MLGAPISMIMTARTAVKAVWVTTDGVPNFSRGNILRRPIKHLVVLLAGRLDGLRRVLLQPSVMLRLLFRAGSRKKVLDREVFTDCRKPKCS